jgi:hypothetical protein
MNAFAIVPAARPSVARPQPAGNAAVPRLPVWDERARKMGFPPSTR